jgi:hypothetical protein
MPRKTETHEWKQVSFPELVTAIGSGTSFSVDQLVSMLSNAEQKGEDFRIVHQDGHFIVPLGLIQEYFKDHARPAPKLSQKEELEYLRKRVADLESVRASVEELKPHPQAPPRPERFQMTPTAPPPRDEGIPTREKMSAEELREDLKKELGAAAPLTRESGTVKKRGRPAAEDKF